MTAAPRKNILIVDDDIAIRRLLEVCLRPLPAHQIAVGGGAAALEVLRRDKIDLVVTDLMMPGTGGLDVVRAMRADPAWHDIPVVLLSCLGDPALPQEASEAGVQAYFMKPFSPSKLVATARQLLAL
jgi:CheY-like chemotaxis protein